MNKLVKYVIESRFNFNIDQLDIEDNEGEFTLSKQQYKSQSMKEEYINAKFVDLGLPSGNLWAKYNLGVDTNYLCDAFNWYGNYYAWGETETKERYNWYTYKYGNGNSYTGQSLSKYVFYRDGICLQPEDDVAYCMNKIWRMPTTEDCQELIDNTKCISQYDYNGISGLNGVLAISKTNENSIFFPASGVSSNKNIDNVGEQISIWTSNFRFNTVFAYYMFYDGYFLRTGYNYRYFGYPIRAITNMK